MIHMIFMSSAQIVVLTTQDSPGSAAPAGEMDGLILKSISIVFKAGSYKLFL